MLQATLESPVNTHKGKIVKVLGPVVDIEFPESLPGIYNAVTCDCKVNGEPVSIILEVQQHLGDKWVRAVSMGERWLRVMTDITGGRTTTVKDINKLPEECALLSRELRSQYLLGYQPSDKVTDGKWRKVKITVKDRSDTDQLRSHYRKGYYANP